MIDVAMMTRAAANVGDRWVSWARRYAERTSPCSLQVATYEVGVTLTTIRRPHCAQNRGGSYWRRRAQRS
jgi:hypothetical protein